MSDFDLYEFVESLLAQQPFPEEQSHLLPESGPPQPETSWLWIEPQNIHEVASSRVLKQQHFQADQSNLVQSSGILQASHQHQGREKGQKRSRPTRGEEQVTMSKSLSVVEALTEIKNLNHQVDRQRGKLGSLRSLLSLIYSVHGESDDFLNLWAKRPDVQIVDKIALELKEIKDKCQKFEQKQGSMEGIPNELAQRLGEIRTELEPILSKLNEESKKVDGIQSLVLRENYDTETLRKMLHELCPWLFNKDQASPDQHDDDNQPIETSPDQHDDEPIEASPDQYDDDEPIEDFIERLDACKRTVGLSDFEGLKTELETCPGWEIPESLKPIVARIEDACEKTATFQEKPDLIMLCAAVKEMEKVQRLEQVSKRSLLNWAAAINRANEVGFHLKSAKMHLKRIAYAYFAPKADEKLQMSEKKRLKLEAEDKLLKECVVAAQEFQGNLCPNGGLFA